MATFESQIEHGYVRAFEIGARMASWLVGRIGEVRDVAVVEVADIFYHEGIDEVKSLQEPRQDVGDSGVGGVACYYVHTVNPP
ncbi:MAG: hypothetical protein R3B93_07295 [Bacteroidia bacterium]